MIVSAHQSNYLPYLGFFKKIIMSDLFIIMENLQFEKKSWQNRNRILNQGKEQWLSVPVLTKEKFLQTIKDVKINNSTPWQNKHFKTIYLNYHKEPFYDEIKTYLEDCYLDRKWDTLYKLNRFWIINFIKLLNIQTPIKWDNQYQFSGSKTELLISICNNTGAKIYLSSPNSVNYIDDNIFKKNNLIHYYMYYNGKRYSFHNKNYSSDLSIIDLICRYGTKVISNEIKKDFQYFQKVSSFHWQIT